VVAVISRLSGLLGWHGPPNPSPPQWCPGQHPLNGVIVEGAFLLLLIQAYIMGARFRGLFLPDYARVVIAIPSKIVQAFVNLDSQTE
jgi:hypothetical protein